MDMLAGMSTFPSSATFCFADSGDAFKASRVSLSHPAFVKVALNASMAALWGTPVGHCALSDGWARNPVTANAAATAMTATALLRFMRSCFLIRINLFMLVFVLLRLM